MRSRVLSRHFWHIGDVPFVVQKWSPESSSNRPDLSSIPFWVDFYGVSDKLFSLKGLKFLANQVGKFEKLHPTTERCIRLDVARVLVIVNLEKELPNRIDLIDTEFQIKVKYPWLPTHCASCDQWGHTTKSCSVSKDKAPLASFTMLRRGSNPELMNTGDDSALPAVDSALAFTDSAFPPLLPVENLTKNCSVVEACDTITAPVSQVTNHNKAEKELVEPRGVLTVDVDSEMLEKKGEVNVEGWTMVQRSNSGSRCSLDIIKEKHKILSSFDVESSGSPTRFNVLALADDDSHDCELEEGELEQCLGSDDSSSPCDESMTLHEIARSSAYNKNSKAKKAKKEKKKNNKIGEKGHQIPTFSLKHQYLKASSGRR